MSIRLRHNYPEKVRYMTRFDAGSIQQKTGLPVSLIYRLRRGEVKTLSETTTSKFSQLYDGYWKERLTKRGGVRPDQADYFLRNNVPVGTLRNVHAQNRYVADRIKEARRNRDSKHPEYRDRWHTRKDILKQMSSDTTRTQGDWMIYVNKWITGNNYYTHKRLKIRAKEQKEYKRSLAKRKASESDLLGQALQ